MNIVGPCRLSRRMIASAGSAHEKEPWTPARRRKRAGKRSRFGRLAIGHGWIAAEQPNPLSLAAWQVGIYRWMAIVHLWLFGEMPRTNPVFWMQIPTLAGFATSYRKLIARQVRTEGEDVDRWESPLGAARRCRRRWKNTFAAMLAVAKPASVSN
jgi:hypothetical protein